MKQTTRDTWNLVTSIGALIISAVALIFSFMAYCGAQGSLVAEKRTEALVEISEARLVGKRLADRYETLIKMRKELIAMDPERDKRVGANLKKVDKKLEKIYDVLNDYNSSTSVVALEVAVEGARSCQKEYEYLLESIEECIGEVEKEVPITRKTETSE